MAWPLTRMESTPVLGISPLVRLPQLPILLTMTTLWRMPASPGPGETPTGRWGCRRILPCQRGSSPLRRRRGWSSMRWSRRSRPTGCRYSTYPGRPPKRASPACRICLRNMESLLFVLKFDEPYGSIRDMVKQNALMDASFWINCCAGGIVQFVPAYFQLLVSTPVVNEIRYPFVFLGMKTYSVDTFEQWIGDGRIVLRDPALPIEWFQTGENAAIGLAVESDSWLLIDDANPYHRAKAFSASASLERRAFTILLFDQGKITADIAFNALRAMRISRGQRRQALSLLETLIRRKKEEQ